MKRIGFIIVLCLSLFSVLCAGAVTSNFNADRSSGCTPLVVNFMPVTPACAGCTYSWSFGTGSPVSGYNASSSFTTLGTHVVTLTVTDGTTTSSSTKTITVYPAPVISFTTSLPGGCPGTAITFTNTSTYGSPGRADKNWSFGDADTDTGNIVNHPYPYSGHYNVTLSITNSQGCTSALTKTGNVHIFDRPVTTFTANRQSICDPPENITFTNTSTGTAPLTNLWTFGDLGTSTTPNPVHTYTLNGNYTVKLKVTDANGCKDSLSKPGFIYVNSVKASFVCPDTVCLYSNVNFTNTSTTHTFRQWLYGDGSTGSSFDGQHIYTTAGTYTVRLVAGYSPCIDTESHVIHVVTGPPGGYIATPAQPCPAEVTVNYTSAAPPGTIVKWLLEQAYTVFGNSINHSYRSDTNVHIVMFKTDPRTGCKDTLRTIDTLYDHVHYLVPELDRGCAPYTVDIAWLTLTSRPDGLPHPYPYGISSINWDFRDGLFASGTDSVTHTFADTGVYVVKVDVVTGNGCTFTDSVSIFVGKPPTATFTASPLHACKTDTITFLADVTAGIVDSFVWDFGDFLAATDTAIARRNYTLPGEFTVTLTPCYNGCCGDTFVRREYLIIDSPKVTLMWKANCAVDRQIYFIDTSMGNDSTIWSFGDGDTSFVRNPAHTYAERGEYPIELIVFNTVSGCSDWWRDTISVVDPHPYFRADVTSLCAADTVYLIPLDTTDARLSFRWIVGDSVTPFNTLPFDYIFSKPGRYTVSMVSFDDNNCYDTVTKVDYITLGTPKAGFYASPPKGCLPASVTFTDTTINVAGLTTVAFKWDFGDGDTALVTSGSVVHVYTATGNFIVTEIVTNDIGCKDTAISTIHVTKASPAFLSSTVKPCINGPVIFTNTSPGIVSSRWTFGDGAISTMTSPAHAYADTGRYDVSLSVIDTNGCRDTVTYPAYIRVDKPKASFNVDDSESVCTPFLVQFYNTTVGGASYAWTFADGNSSVVISPTNSYSVAGLFNARLIASSAQGCKDTAYKLITAHGYTSAFSYTPVSGCSPLTVSFTATLPTVPYILCDFADGVTTVITSGIPVSHTYTIPGAYLPKLIISDTEGCTNSVVGADTIKVSKVTARFTTSPNPVCPGTTFNFVDASTTNWSPIITRIWLYDGITSFATSPSHAITTPGTYPIHLQVINGWGCTATKDTDLVVLDPGTITGTARVCTGQTTLLSNAAPGGTWQSSNGSIATIVAGTVTGVAHGTATITYSVLGCYVTRTVTVDLTPPAITGTMSMCATATTTLANTIIGGTWSSSHATIATVPSVTGGPGVVTGVAAGTSVITYRSPNSCYAAAVVTVNVTPGPIIGDTVFCSSIPTTLTNSVAGGVWSSSDTTIAKITAGGVATGYASGTAFITYAIGDCMSSIKIAVNDTIPAITGTYTVCAGSTAILSNPAAGGTWTSGNLPVATIGAASGIVSGIASGTSVITYSLGGGCRATVVTTVLPVPDPGTIAGPQHVCIGNNITLTDTVTGGTWSGGNTNATISSTGIVSGMAPGTTTVTYTVISMTCLAQVTRDLTVNPLPDPGVISGPTQLCAGATVVLTETIPGGTWASGNTSVATIDTNTGSAVTFIAGSSVVTYFITDVNGCSNSTTFTLSVTPPLFTISNTITDVQCYGGHDGAIVLSVNGTGPFEYLWSTGADSAHIDSLPVGTYSVTVKQPATFCSLTDNFTVAQPDSISITALLIPDTCQLARGSIQVTATGGTAPYTYAWSKPSGKTDTTAMITSLVEGAYSLILTDVHGCADTFSTMLTEDPCNTLVIHDVITPNGDGTNDYWTIERINLYPNNLVQIFDKWGDMVYERRSYNNEWNGQGKNGNQLPDGTYFYVVKLNEVNKFGTQNEFAGSILVKR